MKGATILLFFALAATSLAIKDFTVINSYQVIYLCMQLYLDLCDFAPCQRHMWNWLCNQKGSDKTVFSSKDSNCFTNACTQYFIFSSFSEVFWFFSHLAMQMVGRGSFHQRGWALLRLDHWRWKAGMHGCTQPNAPRLTRVHMCCWQYR